MQTTNIIMDIPEITKYFTLSKSLKTNNEKASWCFSLANKFEGWGYFLEKTTSISKSRAVATAFSLSP